MTALLVLTFAILVIILCATRNPAFFTDLFYRDGKGDQKKTFYNVAGVTATACLLWACYKDNMEDYAFICLFSVYLVTVGGFEVMLKMMSMVIEFKNGKPTSTSSVTTTSTQTEAK